jgi:hypothetical protein
MARKAHSTGSTVGLWGGGVRASSIALLVLLITLETNQAVSASQSNLQVDDLGTEPVMVIEGEGKTLWIGTQSKLFRWDNVPKGAPHELAVPTGTVYALLRDGGTLWIGAKQGLFRWDLKEPEPRRVPNSPEEVVQLHKSGTRLLIRAAQSFLVFEDTPQGAFTSFDKAVASVRTFASDGIDSVWIGSDLGLFHWNGVDEPVLVPIGDNIKVTSITKEGNTLLIGTSRGLIRWVDAPTGPREWVFDDTEVYSLQKDPFMLLVSTIGQGLRGLDDMHAGQWKTIARDIGPSSRYFRNGNDPILWIGAGTTLEAGLYRWDRRTETQPQRVEGINTGRVYRFYKSGDTLWIGAARGLFRLDGLESDWKAGLQITSNKPDTILSDYNLPIRWKIENYGWRTTPDRVYCRVILKGEGDKDITVEGGEGYGRYEVVLPTLPKGDYTLRIEATDLHGKTSLSGPLRFQVNSTWKDIGWRVVEFYGLANIAITILLIFLSRWYSGAFDLFTAPWTQRLSLYFGLALCYSRFVRLWVFERYYQKLKDEFSEDRDYLTAEITRPDGTTVKPNMLLGELQKHPHILIRGEAGTGKTELLKRVLKIYCQSSCLRKAFKLHGFIPIIVPLRDFANPAENGDDTTIPNLARLALGAKDTLFYDKTLFERIVRRKDFLIIIDGLNEADIDKQAIRFVATSPKVRFLATSQTTLLSSGIEVYQLPAMTPEFAKQLLAAFIGEEQAAGVRTAITEEFWTEIKSGYDVRLIQNAVEQKRPVPTTRLELFDATVSSAGEQYTRQVIYEYAWALWKEKKRRFGTDEKLTASLITPLQEAKIVVARGSKFEFRHDLMRGYLAACWAVREASSIAATRSRLSEEGVWGLGVSDQDLVFPFLAELIETQDDLRQVTQFAAEEPAIRVRLFSACKRAAEKKGWAFKIGVNEPSPDLLSAT